MHQSHTSVIQHADDDDEEQQLRDAVLKSVKY